MTDIEALKESVSDKLFSQEPLAEAIYLILTNPIRQPTVKSWMFLIKSYLLVSTL